MDYRLYQKGIISALLLVALSQGQTICAQTPIQWRDSLTVLSKAINQHPQSVDLRLRKAAVNIELGQWDYAIEEYGRVLLMEPRNLTALYFRAYAYEHVRSHEQAKADYESILRLVPSNFEARLGLAMTYRKMGKSVEALDALSQLVQFSPDSAYAYAARAGLEVELKQYDAALYDWEEAIRLDTANVDFRVSKVDVLLVLNKKTEARSLLNEMIRMGVPRAALKEWLERCK
jgi:tetratricopeptide (TPR) repeat protein